MVGTGGPDPRGSPWWGGDLWECLGGRLQPCGYPSRTRPCKLPVHTDLGVHGTRGLWLSRRSRP